MTAAGTGEDREDPVTTSAAVPPLPTTGPVADDGDGDPPGRRTARRKKKMPTASPPQPPSFSRYPIFDEVADQEYMVSMVTPSNDYEHDDEMDSQPANSSQDDDHTPRPARLSGHRRSADDLPVKGFWPQLYVPSQPDGKVPSDRGGLVPLGDVRALGRPVLSEDQAGREVLHVYPLETDTGGRPVPTSLRGGIPAEGIHLATLERPEADLPSPLSHEGKPIPAGIWRHFSIDGTDDGLSARTALDEGKGLETVTIFAPKSPTEYNLAKRSVLVGTQRSGLPVWASCTMNSAHRQGRNGGTVSVDQKLDELYRNQAEASDASLNLKHIHFQSGGASLIKQTGISPLSSLCPRGNLRKTLALLGRPDKATEEFAGWRWVADGPHHLVADVKAIHRGEYRPYSTLAQGMWEVESQMKRAHRAGRPLLPIIATTPIDDYLTPTHTRHPQLVEKKDPEPDTLWDLGEPVRPSAANPLRRDAVPNAELLSGANQFALGHEAFRLPVPPLSLLTLPAPMVGAFADWLTDPAIRKFGLTFHEVIWASYVWYQTSKDPLYLVENFYWKAMTARQKAEARRAAPNDGRCGLPSLSLTDTVLSFGAYLRYQRDQGFSAFKHPALLIPRLRRRTTDENIPRLSSRQVARWWAQVTPAVPRLPADACFVLTSPAQLPSSGMRCLLASDMEDLPVLWAATGMLPMDYVNHPCWQSGRTYLRAMPAHITSLYSLPHAEDEGEVLDLATPAHDGFANRGHDLRELQKLPQPVPTWTQGCLGFPDYWMPVGGRGHSPVQARAGQATAAIGGPQTTHDILQSLEASRPVPIPGTAQRVRRKIEKQRPAGWTPTEKSTWVVSDDNTPANVGYLSGEMRAHGLELLEMRKSSRAVVKNEYQRMSTNTSFLRAQIPLRYRAALSRHINHQLSSGGRADMSCDTSLNISWPGMNPTPPGDRYSAYSQGAESESESEYETVVQVAPPPPAPRLVDAVQRFSERLSACSRSLLCSAEVPSLLSQINGLHARLQLRSGGEVTRPDVSRIVQTGLRSIEQQQSALPAALSWADPAPSAKRPGQMVTAPDHTLIQPLMRTAAVLNCLLVQVGLGASSSLLRGSLEDKASGIRQMTYPGANQAAGLEGWKLARTMVESLQAANNDAPQGTDWDDLATVVDWYVANQTAVTKACIAYRSLCKLIRNEGEPGRMRMTIHRDAVDCGLLPRERAPTSASDGPPPGKPGDGEGKGSTGRHSHGASAPGTRPPASPHPPPPPPPPPAPPGSRITDKDTEPDDRLPGTRDPADSSESEAAEGVTPHGKAGQVGPGPDLKTEAGCGLVTWIVGGGRVAPSARGTLTRTARSAVAASASRVLREACSALAAGEGRIETEHQRNLGRILHSLLGPLLACTAVKISESHLSHLLTALSWPQSNRQALGAARDWMSSRVAALLPSKSLEVLPQWKDEPWFEFDYRVTFQVDTLSLQPIWELRAKGEATETREQLERYRHLAAGLVRCATNSEEFPRCAAELHLTYWATPAEDHVVPTGPDLVDLLDRLMYVAAQAVVLTQKALWSYACLNTPLRQLDEMAASQRVQCRHNEVDLRRLRCLLQDKTTHRTVATVRRLLLGWCQVAWGMSELREAEDPDVWWHQDIRIYLMVHRLSGWWSAPDDAPDAETIVTNSARWVARCLKADPNDGAVPPLPATAPDHAPSPQPDLGQDPGPFREAVQGSSWDLCSDDDAPARYRPYPARATPPRSRSPGHEEQHSANPLKRAGSPAGETHGQPPSKAARILLLASSAD